jgi:hypothetical protein
MPDPQGGTIVLTPAVLVAEKDIDLRQLGKLGEGEFNAYHRLLIEPLVKRRPLYP